MNSLRTILVSLTLILVVGTSWAHDSNIFYQGPGEIGRTQAAAGTVIGIHPGVEENCYLILADAGPSGLGGAGRFFLCGGRSEMKIGQRWAGQVVQTDTRMTRVGQRWRPMSVFRAK